MIQSGKVFFNILLLTSLNDIGAWQELPSLELSQILFNLPVLTWYLMLASSIGLTPAAFLCIIIFLILTWGYVYWFERERERKGEREREREKENERENENKTSMSEKNIDQLSPVCTVTREWNHNPLVYGWCSNQLSHPARSLLTRIPARRRPAGSCVVAAIDCRVLWRKRDSAATLSRGERPDPCLGRLSLPFWVHYIEDDPHLQCTGSM